MSDRSSQGIALATIFWGGVCIFLLFIFMFGGSNSEEQSICEIQLDNYKATALNTILTLKETIKYCDTNSSTSFCPDCICKSECSSSASLRAVEGCHIPEKYFRRTITIRDYTGFSNIPTIFEGNKIKTVTVNSTDKLIPGCFYGFEHEQQDMVHRLMGNYYGYHIFRGDNNEGTEKVEREVVKYLVIGVDFE